MLKHYFRVLRRLYRRRKLNTHFFVHLDDRPGVGGRVQKIPLVVYQTWEDRYVDDEHFEGIKKFRALNPELEFKLFVSEDRDDYMRTHWGHHKIYDLYERSLFHVMKADIFRHCLIFDRGGYYVDINKAVFANIPSLHAPSDSGFLSADMWETHTYPSPGNFSALPFSHKMIASWGFGFVAGHPLLDALINRIVELAEIFDGRMVRSARDAEWAFCGPGVVTDAVRTYVDENGLDGLTITGQFFNGAGVSRIKGSHRMSVKNPYYGDAQNCYILAPRGQ